VFFRQERVGRDGHTFSMLKFRSMVAGADRIVDDLAAESDGNGVLFKHKEDPRVTRVGRVLRRYSLDELPQLPQRAPRHHPPALPEVRLQ
jgi:lipopolysaccharide/colanic/teichoic acid biosynthesis glycosyltransferase